MDDWTLSFITDIHYEMQTVFLEFNMPLVKVQSANFILGKLPA